MAAADFNNDGKTDLFVGGRVVPGRYPDAPRSFLYRNAGGKLVDVTDEVAPGLRNLGMVTAATWADVDGDRKPDLLVATEWGAGVVFPQHRRQARESHGQGRARWPHGVVECARGR